MPLSDSRALASKTFDTRWGVVIFAVAAGMVAAGHVGKMPPMLPAIREELVLGMVFGGWVYSTFALVGAALAPFVGAFADRLGAWRAMAVGFALIVAGSGAGAFASTGILLLCCRIVEGIGFLGVAVSAPMVIAAMTDGRNRRLALGLWGTYLPAGVSGMMLVAPLVANFGGWRGLWMFAGGLALLCLPVAILVGRQAPLPRHDVHQPVAAVLGRCARLPGPWLLAGGFCLYTIPWATLMVWLPTFLIETRGVGGATASVLSAIFVFCNVPGNLAAGWLLRRGVARWVLMAAAMVAMGSASLVIFSDAMPDGVRYLCCLVFSGFGGLLPTAVLAGAPVFAPSPSTVGTVNGMLVQGSNTGQVIGPPLAAFAVTAAGGWHGAMGVIVVACACGLVLAFAVRKVENHLHAV